MATRGEVVKGTNNKQRDVEMDIDQVLGELPPEQRDKVEQIMISQIAMISRSSPEAEIGKKITPEHISTMLETRGKAMEYAHKDEWQSKVFYTVIVLLVIGAVFGIITLLKDIPEIMERVLTVIITAIISGIGGYGIGKTKGINKES